MQIEIVARDHPLAPSFQYTFFHQGEIFQSVSDYLSTQETITWEMINQVCKLLQGGGRHVLAKN